MIDSRANERTPLTSVDKLADLDGDEVLEGYRDGRGNEPPPGGNRSHSYWHGYRNGQADGGHTTIDAAQRTLAHDYVGRSRRSS